MSRVGSIFRIFHFVCRGGGGGSVSEAKRGDDATPRVPLGTSTLSLQGDALLKTQSTISPSVGWLHSCRTTAFVVAAIVGEFQCVKCASPAVAESNRTQ